MTLYQSVVKVARAPRPFLRPPDKARFGVHTGSMCPIATQSAGMQGRSNAVTTFATGWYGHLFPLQCLGTASDEFRESGRVRRLRDRKRLEAFMRRCGRSPVKPPLA